jgi:hypothetical protein
MSNCSEQRQPHSSIDFVIRDVFRSTSVELSVDHSLRETYVKQCSSGESDIKFLNDRSSADRRILIFRKKSPPPHCDLDQHLEMMRRDSFSIGFRLTRGYCMTAVSNVARLMSIYFTRLTGSLEFRNRSLSGKL